MNIDGPLWTQVASAAKHDPRTTRRRDIPIAPGVYIWFKNGEPVYAGRAKGAKGLRDRLSNHLAKTVDLSRSTFRASVASDLLGLSRAVTTARPSVLTLDQIALVNDWISGCQLAWVECESVEATIAFEIALISERRPPLNIQ
ncbi:hypothetical protein A20C1_09569 [marine actinobacterium PHSC20C1]|nr:hypothetical protein A20C1_09569 [marine actinobacterium PHSC20C1]